MNSNAIKILICGAEKFQMSLIEDELTRSFRNIYLGVVETLSQAEVAISKECFDFLIIDLIDDSEIEAVERLAEKLKNCPVLVLSESSKLTSNLQKIIFVEKNSATHQELPDIIRYRLKAQLIHYRRELEKQKESIQKQDSELIRITTGTLSHQINNPLMTIMGLTELILEENGAYDAELSHRVQIIRDSAEQIQNALRVLSEISKPNIRQTVSGPMLIADLPELEPQID